MQAEEVAELVLRDGRMTVADTSVHALAGFDAGALLQGPGFAAFKEVLQKGGLPA